MILLIIIAILYNDNLNQLTFANEINGSPQSMHRRGRCCNIFDIRVYD